MGFFVENDWDKCLLSSSSCIGSEDFISITLIVDPSSKDNENKFFPFFF